MGQLTWDESKPQFNGRRGRDEEDEGNFLVYEGVTQAGPVLPTSLSHYTLVYSSMDVGFRDIGGQALMSNSRWYVWHLCPMPALDGGERFREEAVPRHLWNSSAFDGHLYVFLEGQWHSCCELSMFGIWGADFAGLAVAWTAWLAGPPSVHETDYANNKRSIINYIDCIRL